MRVVPSVFPCPPCATLATPVLRYATLASHPNADLMKSAEQIHAELLVLRAQDRDAAALAELVALHHPRLLAYARSRVGDADSADAAQEAWLRTMRKLPQLRDPAAFPGWLRKIASNVCIDELRRRQLRDSLVPEPADEPDWTDDQVARSLAVLPSAQRDLLVAHYLEEIPLLDIARRLDRPIGTIKSRLHYARRVLRAFLAS
ncbi:MAG: RNA polymerase subunit sigma-24 [Gammaproteobacteria bacterium]|nr:RNA polymerase subunit sigma-24 [Gammaproteobacteria bacterium]